LSQQISRSMTTIINTLRWKKKNVKQRHEGGEIMLIYANLFISFSFHFISFLILFFSFRSINSEYKNKQETKKEKKKKEFHKFFHQIWIYCVNYYCVNLQFTFIYITMIIKIQRVSAIVIKPLTIYTQLKHLVNLVSPKNCCLL
jgi:hypothetical protein